jgi:serine protease Do
MFNLKGRVIGINTAIFSPTGGSVGIGFAIPASTAKPVIDQLIKNGSVKRGWLGVHIQTVTEEIAETLGLGKAEGALVANVIKDSPASSAGIKAGDVILSFDEKKVEGMRSLPKIVAETRVGKDAKVKVWRSGKIINLRVAVGELEEDKKLASSKDKQKEGDHEIKELGLTVTAITDQIKRRFKLLKGAKGLVVTKVEKSGPAAEKNVRVGDLIVEVSQEEVTSVSDMLDHLRKVKEAGRKTLLLLLEGAGGMRFVVLRMSGE